MGTEAEDEEKVMKIHEYQAKHLLAQRGVPVPPGEVAERVEEAVAIAERIGPPVAIKAQVLVGGRGKAGGIRVASTLEEVPQVAGQILGMNLKGLMVQKVLVEKALDIQAEYYIGLTLDRASQRNVLMVCTEGGVDIEEVAARSPEKIAKVFVDPAYGLFEFQMRLACYRAGLPRSLTRAAVGLIHALYRTYVEVDATLAEINPLVLTAEGQLVAADAKILIDDNALFRHPELAQWQEESEEDPLEAEAHRRGLQYVHLGGNIGVIGNGAGLTMATIDEVKRAGGQPANFLDIGGGARAEVVKKALEMVLLDPQVKGVLINIFGGITRCDEVARGILAAISEMDVRVPIVVRLTGTNEEEGRRLLEGSPLTPAATMQEAAAKIVALVEG